MIPKSGYRFSEKIMLEDKFGRPAMLRRSRDLFRWARERRRQSDRFAEPSIFHQLKQRWDPVTPRLVGTETMLRTRKPKLPLFWRGTVPPPRR